MWCQSSSGPSGFWQRCVKTAMNWDQEKLGPGGRHDRKCLEDLGQRPFAREGMQFDMTMSEIRVVCQVPNLRDEKALEQKAAARDLALWPALVHLRLGYVAFVEVAKPTGTSPVCSGLHKWGDAWNSQSRLVYTSLTHPLQFKRYERSGPIRDWRAKTWEESSFRSNMYFYHPKVNRHIIFSCHLSRSHFLRDLLWIVRKTFTKNGSLIWVGISGSMQICSVHLPSQNPNLCSRCCSPPGKIEISACQPEPNLTQTSDHPDWTLFPEERSRFASLARMPK